MLKSQVLAEVLGQADHKPAISPKSKTIVDNLRGKNIHRWADMLFMGQPAIDLSDVQSVVSVLDPEDACLVGRLLSHHISRSGTYFIQHEQFITMAMQYLGEASEGPTSTSLKKPRSRSRSSSIISVKSLKETRSLQPFPLRPTSAPRARPESPPPLSVSDMLNLRPAPALSQEHLDDLSRRLAGEKLIPASRRQAMDEEIRAREMSECTFAPNTRGATTRADTTRAGDRLFRSGTVASIMRAASPARSPSADSLSRDSSTADAKPRMRRIIVDGEQTVLEVRSPIRPEPTPDTLEVVRRRVGRRRRDALLSTEDRELAMCTFKPQVSSRVAATGKSLAAARIAHKAGYAEESARQAALEGHIAETGRRTRRSAVLRPATSPYGTRATIGPKLGYAKRAQLKRTLEREAGRAATGFGGLWRTIDTEDEAEADLTGSGMGESFATIRDPSRSAPH